MKKYILSTILVFTSFLITVAQDIPNASFENWYSYAFGEYPNSWTTSDSVAVANGGGTSVSKSTDAYDGTFSIKLKSVQVTIFGFPVKGPGIATNGLVSLVGTSFVFSGGSPDTARSQFFTARYKYAPAGPFDVAVVKVYLLKYNGSTRDTIADGVQEISGAHSTWDQLVLQMSYRDFITQPDTCLIILQSSRGLNDPSMAVGSEFLVDSVGFSGFVGVDELKNSISSVNVFPVPANNELNVDVQLRNPIALSYEIYDSRGKLIKSEMMNSTKEKIDVSKLAAGKYILKLGDRKKNHLHSSGFSIVR